MKKLIAAAFVATALLTGTALAGDGGDDDDPRGGGPEAGYRVTSLPSLGGTSSVGNSINNRGWVAGRSNLPGNQSRHATLWRDGAVTDLGTLGGPNSAVLWPVKNRRGIVSGIAQTAEPDPLGERWSCGFFFPAATGTGYRCLGFRWEDGVMSPLPTLGGTHGFATGTNNRGETVGWAENTVRDPTCVAPQVLQFRAVLWGARDARPLELPPLAGDTVSAATALNDRGQVVGISGICDQAAGRLSAIHAVRWEHGVPVDIGALGGVAWNTPMAINQRGDIVGFANASAADGSGFNPRAVVWLRGGAVRNLGTLPGDSTSQALGINRRRQIVGQSCDADDNCRAFLWQHGVMTDLNQLVASGDDVLLTTANDIDDRSRITGQALNDDAGQFVAYVAEPGR